MNESENRIINGFERHVCAEALKTGVTLGDCDTENWPSLVPDAEKLIDIFWDMGVHGVFADVRLIDLIIGGRAAIKSQNLDYSMDVELPDIWAAKLQGGSPQFGDPDLRRWLYDAMGIVLRFCSVNGFRVTAIMSKGMKLTLTREH